MEKLLIIAEKPSAARNFKTALGGASGTFEGDEYQIVNLFGHILAHETPEKVAYPQYRETVGGFSNLENLPWDYKWFDFDKKAPSGRDVGSIKNLIADIKGYLTQGYIPVIACDNDAMGEGDMLAAEVLTYVGYKGKVYREYHVDETPKEIVKALRNKKDVTARNEGLIKAETRSTLDFLTQQLVRAATVTIQTKGYRLPRPVPVGRLQSTIMKLVGDQIQALNNYRPSSVWESRYKLDDLVLMAEGLPQFATKESWNGGSLPEKAKVKEVKAAPGKTAPPKALSLTVLGKLMAGKGISSDRTMKLCQKMYEDSVITYPRTEDNFVTPEQFNESLQTLDTVIRLMGMDPGVFTHREPRRTHVKEGGSHGALRPGTNIPNDIAELDAKYGNGASAIYRTITERFLSMFLEDTEWIRHDYETVGTEPVFKGSIRVITRKGVTDPDEDMDDIKQTLPDVQNKLAELHAHEVKTVAPRKPNEAWLLDQLVKLNVGTPSTQVPTVGRMIGKEGNFPMNPGAKANDPLSLTPIGAVGWQVASGISLGTPECTRRYEEMVKDIIEGKLTQDMCYKQFTQTMKEDIESIYRMSFNFDSLGFEKQAEKAIGTWNGETVKIPVSHAGHRFTQPELDTLFSGQVLTFEGLDFNKNPIQVGIRLAHMAYKGKPYVGFQDAAYFYGTFKGEEIKFKRTYMGHEFTDAECNSLLAGAELMFTATMKDGSQSELKGRLEKQKTSSGAVFYGVKAEFPLRDGYIRGTFKGQQVTFKGSWSDHVFTQDEVDRLLAGETITIEYTAKDGHRKPVSGKLEKQTYQGRPFFGFKADFGGKKGKK